GNAVDAAVCAAFMLGVVDFTNSGLGGDGFALIHLPAGQIIAFDGSIQRPADDSANKSDAGLPACPEMLFKLLREFGRRSRAEVMAPAIKTCFKGFQLSPYLHGVIKNKLLNLEDEAAIGFLAPDGYALPAGHLLKQPQLGQTLMQLARDGGRSFYGGKDAKAMVSHLKSLGSTYEMGDFENFRSLIKLPVKKEWQSFSLYGTPPPSSSVAAIKLACKLVELDVDLFLPVADNIKKISQITREIIDFKYNFLSHYLNSPDLFLTQDPDARSQNAGAKENDSMTTHVCVWDQNNLAVSMTLTLGSHCGSGNLSPLGFFYNNEMRNYKEVVARYPEDYPRKAGPVSSKAPVMLKKNGRLVFITGGAGSDRIIANVGLLCARFMANPEKAMNSIDDPRYFLDYKDCLNYEWFPAITSNDFFKLNFDNAKLRESGDDFFGLVAAIAKEESAFTAAGDFRRDGHCRAIQVDPLQKRSFALQLFFNRKKGFNQITVSGPIEDHYQSTTGWKSAEAFSSKKTIEGMNFAYQQKQHADKLATRVKVMPQNSRGGGKLANLFSKRPVFVNENQVSPAVAEYCQNFMECNSYYELIESLMVDIGFSLPYRKVRKKTSADQLLQMGFGDCSGKARLMNEVLQAFGMETRLVGGLIARPGTKTSTHIWVEIKTENEWLPVCPVNFHFGQIPTNWVKLRHGDRPTVTPGGKLIFTISEKNE
ncbi:MAG: gamma-glutamyltransferase, partial [Candidatus Rifleibacteriota bacterium]